MNIRKITPSVIKKKKNPRLNKKVQLEIDVPCPGCREKEGFEGKQDKNLLGDKTNDS